MFANALVVFLLAWLVLPGIWLAQKPWVVNSRVWLTVFLANLVLFTVLGILFKILPWLIDPRVRL